jgi:hypothetical protein
MDGTVSDGTRAYTATYSRPGTSPPVEPFDEPGLNADDDGVDLERSTARPSW